MEVSGLGLVLVLVFNAAVCVMLPRMITLNWTKIFNQLSSQQKSKQEGITVQ